MFERLKNAWGAIRGEDPLAMSLRRWEAAKTDRLNSAHWANAHSKSVNADLTLDRETLVKRSMYEAENNPFVEGVIQTHVASVVGADGPTLQVQCEGHKNYSDGLEGDWNEFAKAPEITGQQSLVEVLRANVRLLWTNGDWLIQEVEHPDALPGEISYRWNVIHPRRLKNPLSGYNRRIIDGVERDELGRPITYYITDLDTDEYGWLNQDFNSKPFSAGRVIHDFNILEPGQVRGVPLLAPCLQPIADLRDYDTSVLDACRQATDFAAILTTNHPDANYVAVNESTDIPRRRLSTAPPGWQLNQLDPKHPTTNYVDYRKERLRELGRPVNMPLMMVTLDSGDHNYSSARFDGQLFNRGVICFQSRTDRVLLNRSLERIERQAILSGRIPKRPKNVNFEWTWTAAPHVDPQKEALAWGLLIQIGAASEYDAAAAMGRDFERVTAARKRAKELLEAAGLPPTGTLPMSAAEESLAETAATSAKQTSKKKATVGA